MALAADREAAADLLRATRPTAVNPLSWAIERARAAADPLELNPTTPPASRRPPTGPSLEWAPSASLRATARPTHCNVSRTGRSGTARPAGVLRAAWEEAG